MKTVLSSNYKDTLYAQGRPRASVNKRGIHTIAYIYLQSRWQLCSCELCKGTWNCSATRVVPLCFSNCVPSSIMKTELRNSNIKLYRLWNYWWWLYFSILCCGFEIKYIFYKFIALYGWIIELFASDIRSLVDPCGSLGNCKPQIYF